jgi:hypothetical protein
LQSKDLDEDELVRLEEILARKKAELQLKRQQQLQQQQQATTAVPAAQAAPSALADPIPTPPAQSPAVTPVKMEPVVSPAVSPADTHQAPILDFPSPPPVSTASVLHPVPPAALPDPSLDEPIGDDFPSEIIDFL